MINILQKYKFWQILIQDNINFEESIIKGVLNTT